MLDLTELKNSVTNLQAVVNDRVLPALGNAVNPADVQALTDSINSVGAALSAAATPG